MRWTRVSVPEDAGALTLSPSQQDGILLIRNGAGSGGERNLRSKLPRLGEEDLKKLSSPVTLDEISSSENPQCQMRLKDLIPKCVHPDQTGFVKDGEGGNNVVKLLHLIHICKSISSLVAFVALDVEKTFDSVSWSYLTSSMSSTSVYKTILVVSIITIVVLSFIFNRYSQPLKMSFLQKAFSVPPVAQMNHTKSNMLNSTMEHDSEVDQIYKVINSTISHVSFTHLNKTTSAKKSRAIILDYRQTYCTGDSLIVRVDMFNHLGERKAYGGDFLRARIYSPSVRAAASGRTEDLNNGSYNIHFTLSWEGYVKISIILFYPSEGVSALWKARNMGYENIMFIGKFQGIQAVQSECGFYLESQAEKCEYTDKTYDEFFYCLKPPSVPCGALISMMTKSRPHSYLTEGEKKIFTRSNIAVEIGSNIGNINVLNCQRKTMEVKQKCHTGMSLPFPSGYFLNDTWHSLFCNLSSYEPLSQIGTCLSGKLIYLMGDSTLRQWFEHFVKHVKSLKLFNLPGKGLHKTFLAVDVKRNTYVQWKKHGHPFVSSAAYSVKDCAFVSSEIDKLPGSPDTVIAITLGQHFRGFPVSLYIRRLLNVRKAIERLFERGPESKVIIKLENTRDISTDVERISDFHGFVQCLIVKHVFKGLNVGIIDAWDMTVAFSSNNLHPPDTVIKNQVNMLLAYIC
ncbi:NXPE family member 1-like [Pelodytes ibericus]